MCPIFLHSNLLYTVTFSLQTSLFLADENRKSKLFLKNIYKDNTIYIVHLSYYVRIHVPFWNYNLQKLYEPESEKQIKMLVNFIYSCNWKFLYQKLSANYVFFSNSYFFLQEVLESIVLYDFVGYNLWFISVRFIGNTKYSHTLIDKNMSSFNFVIILIVFYNFVSIVGKYVLLYFCIRTNGSINLYM